MPTANPFQTVADAITGTLVTSVTALSGSVAAILSAPALLGLTAYILWMGYLTVLGKVDTPVPTLVWKFVKISLIVFFAVGAGAYQSLIVPAINGLESSIVGALSGVGATSIPDSVWRTSVELDQKLAAIFGTRTPPELGIAGVSVSMPDFQFALFEVVVRLSQEIMAVLAIIPYLIAKVTLGILMALGPLFIILLIWPATQRFFESWVSAVVAAVMTFAILAAIIGFILPIMTTILAGIDGATLGLGGIAATLIPIYLVLGWIAFTSGSLAGQLAGGGGSGNPLASLVGSGVHHVMGAAFRGGSKGAGGGKGGGQVNNKSGGSGKGGGQPGKK